jgi:hypothetical protein
MGPLMAGQMGQMRQGVAFRNGAGSRFGLISKGTASNGNHSAAVSKMAFRGYGYFAGAGLAGGEVAAEPARTGFVGEAVGQEGV